MPRDVQYMYDKLNVSNSALLIMVNKGKKMKVEGNFLMPHSYIEAVDVYISLDKAHPHFYKNLSLENDCGKIRNQYLTTMLITTTIVCGNTRSDLSVGQIMTKDVIIVHII